MAVSSRSRGVKHSIQLSLAAGVPSCSWVSPCFSWKLHTEMVRAAKPCALLCLSLLGSCTWENGVCRCVIPKPRLGSAARVGSGASAQYPLLKPQTCHPAVRARALRVQPASTPCTWAREGVRASPVPTAAAQPESRLLAMKQARKPPQ